MKHRNRIISPENQNFYNISITLHGFLMIVFLVMPGENICHWLRNDEGLLRCSSNKMDEELLENCTRHLEITPA